jgi:hypothetical protein
MEFLIEEFKDLPGGVTSSFMKIREFDKQSHAIMQQVRDEEKRLTEDVAAASKADPAFDEAPFQERFRNNAATRKEVVALLEKQMRTIQEVYNDVDSSISSLGKSQWLQQARSALNLVLSVVGRFWLRLAHAEQLRSEPASAARFSSCWLSCASLMLSSAQSPLALSALVSSAQSPLALRSLLCVCSVAPFSY